MQFKYNINCLVLALILCFCLQTDATAQSRPNILIIVGDDMGYADVGFQGVRDYSTPNLDKLASDGVRFTNGYVSGPYCSPTRAGLLTGRYQTRFGHEFNPGGATTGLPIGEVTIADRLRAAGYKTGLVGKWHLGSKPEMQPQKRGFDEFYGFLGGAHSYFDKDGILRGTENVTELDYTTDAFGREAVSFIDRHRKDPWLLCLTFNAVHTPMHARPDLLSKLAHIENKQRRDYAAMMVAMDDAIGNVRKKLAETGLDKNTMIAFISDNGGPTMPGVTVNGSINTPLRGSKRTTLEGGIRVPFLLAWPGKIKPAVYEKPVIQLDLHATAIAAAGVSQLPEWKLDGTNLIPFVKGEDSGSPHEAVFWRFGEQMAVRSGDWKLVRYDSNADTLTGKTNQPVTSYRLYNLADDIHEDHDLSKTHTDKVKELQALWQKWNESNIRPLWGKDSGVEPSAKGATGKVAAKKKQQRKKAEND